jgi:hypothetical protein
VVKSEEPVVTTDLTEQHQTVQQPYFKTEENKAEPVKPAQEQLRAQQPAHRQPMAFGHLFRL